jgi:integrase
VTVLTTNNIDVELFKAAGLERVSKIPHLFDDDGNHLREPSQFLRELALREWPPKNNAGRTIFSPMKRRPSPGSLDTYAYRLANFFDWLKKRKLWKLKKDRLCLNNLNYDHILRFQNEQASGKWAQSGRKLNSKTANARADVADWFLCWASDRGLCVFSRRQATSTRLIADASSSVPVKIDVSARPDRLPESDESDDFHLRDMPTPFELNDWLHDVRLRRGEAKWQLIRFLLCTGCRSMEVEALKARQIPSQAEIDKARAGYQESIEIDLVVTKGRKPRTIRPPITAVQRLRSHLDSLKRRTHSHRWNINFKRPSVAASEEPCFLSDRNDHFGRPITKSSIYKVFKQVPLRRKLSTGTYVALNGMSTHKTRHIFACCFLLQFLLDDCAASGRAPQWDYAMQRGTAALKLLRRELGHVNEKTTEIYLRWVMSVINIPNVYEQLHEILGD